MAEPAQIDRTLAALGDPTRRRVVDLLKKKPRRAGELAAHFDMSAPAMSRHLRVLRTSGLIEEEDSREEDLRVRTYRLRRAPFHELEKWLVRRAKAAQRRELKFQPLAANAEFRTGQLPLALRAVESASFDAAIDTLLLCNLDDPNALALVREVARIVRPGGHYVVQYRLDAAHEERFEPVAVEDLLPREITRLFEFATPLLRTRLADFGEDFLGRSLGALLITGPDVVAASRERRAMMAEAEALYARYDVLVTASPGPAPVSQTQPGSRSGSWARIRSIWRS